MVKLHSFWQWSPNVWLQIHFKYGLNEKKKNLIRTASPLCHHDTTATLCSDNSSVWQLDCSDNFFFFFNRQTNLHRSKTSYSTYDRDDRGLGHGARKEQGREGTDWVGAGCPPGGGVANCNSERLAVRMCQLLLKNIIYALLCKIAGVNLSLCKLSALQKAPGLASRKLLLTSLFFLSTYLHIRWVCWQVNV